MQKTSKIMVNPISRFFDLTQERSTFRDDVLKGLSAESKALSSKYFYDERGSKLFDLICSSQEYYPTRTESQILDENAWDMLEGIPGPIALIELGSGSSVKTRFLLESSDHIEAYIPIDISKEHLLQSTLMLAERFPHIAMTPISADYTQLESLPEIEELEGATPVVFFPGSTIGNLDERECLNFLHKIYQLLRGQGYLLLGIDLLKDPKVLEPAYNDSCGYTAAFNLNLLERINRELQADFDCEGFEHEAIFNGELGRIEMYLRSRRDQNVIVGDQLIEFKENERIHTESSYKYERNAFAGLAKQAGFQTRRTWTDARQYFAVVLLETDPLFLLN